MTSKFLFLLPILVLITVTNIGTYALDLNDLRQYHDEFNDRVNNITSAKMFFVNHYRFGMDVPPSFYNVSEPIRTLYLKIIGFSVPIRARVMATLKDISRNDIPYLEIDDSGGVYYREPAIYEYPDDTEVIYSFKLKQNHGTNCNKNSRHTFRIDPDYESTGIPTLHSRQGSHNIIYLDFDGETISDRAWNSGAILNCEPFDLDSNPTDFSVDETNRIVDIHARIAEDFAPWNVDVTTERPPVFNSTTVHAMITRSNPNLPAYGAGGVAYLGVFGTSYYQYYSPAFIYFDALGNGNPKYIAEAASHEIGHNLGLSHDGTTTQGYYGGHGSGAISWAPIMGVGYNAAQSQWSKGQYANANNQEDDLAIITNKLSLRPLVPPVLTISSQTGCTVYYIANNIIRTTGELNSYPLTITQSYNIIINARAFKAPWNPTDVVYRGNNLDILMYLIKDNSVINSTYSVGTPDASINQSLQSGNYNIVVVGSGDITSPFTNYGSLGQYTLTVCLNPICVCP